jgi:pimeloyl-ACP methyl ester carboxylesterase
MHERERPTRRALLATVSGGAAALAGCTDVFSDEESNDGSGGDDAPETAEEVVGALVDDLAAEEFESAADWFSPEVTSQQLVAQLERLWMGLSGAGDEYEEIAGTETTTVQGTQAVLATLQFTQAAADLRVLHDDQQRLHGASIVGQHERADYVDGAAFDERTVELPTDDCIIEGTLTVPDADGEVPGVVLVHGSGPVDRDQTVGASGSAIQPNKPFKDLAEGLASQGVAVLRYDKRTYACNVDPADATFDRIVVADTLAAVDRIRDVESVGSVAVVGHSLGGMAMPQILDRADGLAGGVALAAPARPLEDVALSQFEYLADVGEYTLELNQTQLQSARRMADQIKNGEYERHETLFQESGAFWDSIADYDQVATAKRLDAPLLFVQGERDYRVSPEEDFERWRSELGDGASFESYERLNHLFVPGYGPSVPEEYLVANNVAEQVVTDVADWVIEL